MPYEVMKSDACPISKPWACVKEGGDVMGCHASKEEATDQLKALYANEKKALADHNSNTNDTTPKMVQMSGKELHDRWLEQKPEAASHDETTCPYCAPVKPAPTGGTGDPMSDKTFSKEEVDAAVAAAVAPLQARMADLEAEKSAEEIQTQIDEAKAEVESQLAEVQKELDLKTAEADAAKQELEDVKAYLTAEVEAQAEAAAKEARKADRIEKVKEAASYSDEYVATHADRWAAWDDEEFAGFLSDLKATGVKPNEKPPVDTALNMGGENASLNGGGEKSALSGLREVVKAGFDPRRI